MLLDTLYSCSKYPDYIFYYTIPLIFYHIYIFLIIYICYIVYIKYVLSFLFFMLSFQVSVNI